MKKLLLPCLFIIIFLSSILIPRTYAQEWIYNGVDTEKIPNHSVYPSEWYIYDIDAIGFPAEILLPIEITHGNITNIMGENGTCVWGNGWVWNTTSGEKILDSPDLLLSYWNETLGYVSDVFSFIIPVANDGKVSPSILAWVELFISSSFSSNSWENTSINPLLYSISYWNESYNNAYIHFNYTDDGIIFKWESNYDMGNMFLYSQPAQLPPVFSFTTEDDSLIVNSTDIDLKVAIADADNNNDGVIDTDYEYRILNGSTWTAWAPVPPLIGFDLGIVSPGNYTILMEVKNMYGTTQQQIEIQYEPPEEEGEQVISGYLFILISIALLLGVSFLILKNRVKK